MAKQPLDYKDSEHGELFNIDKIREVIPPYIPPGPDRVMLRENVNIQGQTLIIRTRTTCNWGLDSVFLVLNSSIKSEGKRMDLMRSGSFMPVYKLEGFKSFTLYAEIGRDSYNCDIDLIYIDRGEDIDIMWESVF